MGQQLRGRRERGGQGPALALIQSVVVDARGAVLGGAVPRAAHRRISVCKRGIAARIPFRSGGSWGILSAVIGRRTAIVALATLTLAAAPAALAANTARPRIKGVEVGYFGSATVTRHVSVFVYSNLGPSAGDRVTVCLGGVCERAHGHNARLAWYRADFTTGALRMGDAVRFTATAADAAGSTRRSVRRDLLCMHNSGSTPQS